MRGKRGTSRPYLRGKIWWIRYSAPDEEGNAAEHCESSKSKDERDALRLLRVRQRQVDDFLLPLGAPKSLYVCRFCDQQFSAREMCAHCAANPYKRGRHHAR